jgi:hypothetical protein
MSENLNKMFNLPTVAKPVKAEVVVEPKAVIDDQAMELEDDFQAARENIKELIKKGDDALDGIMDVAKMGEHPRAFEVAGQLIKTLIDANKDLIKIHADARPKVAKGPSGEVPHTVNNTMVFNGTTKELAEHIKKTRENKTD